MLSTPPPSPVVQNVQPVTVNQSPPVSQEEYEQRYGYNRDKQLRAVTIMMVEPYRGETLWHIAKVYLHDPYAWKQIARDNGITNPHRVPIGKCIWVYLWSR